MNKIYDFYPLLSLVVTLNFDFKNILCLFDDQYLLPYLVEEKFVRVVDISYILQKVPCQWLG